MMVSYLGSPLLYDHIHCIQSNVHLSNDMQCDLTQHWKHWSSSVDITLTVDEDNKVAVSYCVAWNLSTSLMASARV